MHEMTHLDMSSEEHVEVAAPIEPEAKKRVFKAAIESFSLQGRAGSRIDEIVKESKVNVRMIYHYFGSKDGLYDEVLKAVCLNRSDFLRQAKSQAATWGLKDLSSALMAWSIKESAFRKILDWESCSDWRWCAMAVESQIEAPTELAPEGCEEGWISRLRLYHQLLSPLTRLDQNDLSGTLKLSIDEELKMLLATATNRNDTV